MTKELVIEEDFIGLMPLERTNAENIAYAIKDVSINDAKVQCYDGCSTMTMVYELE